MKNILLVDDSALMRRVLCDIIESDKRFHVQDRAVNGLDALNLLSRKTYDAVVLDVNMPQMNGLELLKQLQKRGIRAKIIMASSVTAEGAKVTLEALELGALDFIRKPSNALDCRSDVFIEEFLRHLATVAEMNVPVSTGTGAVPGARAVPPTLASAAAQRKDPAPPPVSSGKAVYEAGAQIVAIASSTGGPKALQAVIPKLPADLKAPVVVVQHMPVGFTASLAERLDSLSAIHVKEAAEGDAVLAGNVYIAMGGKHLNILQASPGKYTIHYSDEPLREGVKPCANYMYESLMDSRFDRVLCVVMTGMGADGTQGIKHLKEKKKIHVIAQEASTCAVYGMPKSAVNAQLADQIVPLEQIAQEIITNVGVK
ncbi:MAG: chemotaxis-specific protein-glutamate methyltransferase CheB [Bacteroidales bacterium]|nr:chemotaxis-specific protein-glutamate methyltransferase CheB [Bacteroidales bacterium]MCM1415607.1 chemotaxis-specific protein-glutamate methyltransferase CheB [bacterium]MCM1423000.1 chemotaxis-specific protein-glutamate methyltransferase CheB [bacterium]